MNPTDLQRWLRQSIYDAPSSDSRKRILDEYVQGLIAIARAAAAVSSGYQQSGNPWHAHRRPAIWDDDGKPCESCAAWIALRTTLDQLGTDQ